MDDVQPQSVQQAQREVERLYACSRLVLLLTARERQIARYYGLAMTEILVFSTPQRGVILGFSEETPREVGFYLHRTISPGPIQPGWSDRARQAIATMEAKYGARLTGRESSDVKYAREFLARKVRER